MPKVKAPHQIHCRYGKGSMKGLVQPLLAQPQLLGDSPELTYLRVLLRRGYLDGCRSTRTPQNCSQISHIPKY